MLASVRVSSKARDHAAEVLDEVLPPMDGQPILTSQDSGFTMSNEEIDRAADTPMQSIQDVVKVKQHEAKQFLEKKELEAKNIIDAIVKR